VRYLVVGYGNIGRRRAALLGDRCVAVVDPVAPDAPHRDAAEVDPRAYDAVVLATPNDVKLAYLRRFLAAGKHVLVEKPVLFPSRGEAEALRQAARDGAVWYTSYNHRFEPLVQALRRRLEDGAVGELDRAHLRYGNGTVRHWRGTWREAGGGVLEDLGCHLLDLCGFLLGHRETRYRLLDLRPVESATYDYALFASADRRVLLEAGTVFWKNSFTIDVYGSAGSLHLDGLNKWGGATLVERRRVLPSGAPVESREATSGPDATWEVDLAVFEARARAGRDSLENDCRIAEATHDLLAQAGWLDREAGVPAGAGLAR
jgi:scyllo-inositol 2-dehydrogenase (NADP+)